MLVHLMNVIQSFIKKKWNDWYYHDIDSDDDSDEIAWDDINENDERFFQDNESRKAYVIETLERMAEAAEKTEETRAEFDAVTSLLIDMEEIESLPGSAMDKIKDIATKIQQLEQQRRKIFSNTDALSEKAMALATKVYEEAAKERQTAEGGEESTTANNDNVQEASYEEK